MLVSDVDQTGQFSMNGSYFSLDLILDSAPVAFSVLYIHANYKIMNAQEIAVSLVSSLPWEDQYFHLYT
jgi:hypothetical protein